MKALKKIAVLLSSAVMMTSFSGVMPYNYNSITVNAEEAAEAEITVWDGTSDTSWYDAEETELYISTAEELAGFASLVNNGKKMTGQTIYLENDILLNETNDTSNSWKTIGPSKTYYFDGTFDGQNHTISGLYGQGLFGYSGWSSIIRNVNINNAKVTNNSYSYVYNGYYAYCYAMICGYNNGVISNCISNGTVSAYSSTSSIHKICAGGIVAVNNGDILRCRNNAKISSAAYNTSSYEHAYAYAGGICGLNESSYISECNNSGYIYSIAGAYYSYAYSGGICGYEDGSSNSQYIDNCYNTGKVSSETTPDYSYAGGIVGYSYSSEKYCNVYNTGEIANADYLGGIIGYDNSSSALTACYYLNSTALKGVGNKTTDSAISKSEANMKTASFVESLGDAFVYNENSYPILLWEADFDVAKIEETDISLTEYNQQKTLTLKTNYEETPTWISSDTNIATVENGVVTAKNNGECTIYAVCGEARAECKVTVDYEYRLNWTSVKLEPKLTSNLKVISDKTDIAATGFEIEWTSSDESVATVENGTVVAVKAGTATITASFGDNKLECEITVNSTEQPTEAPVPALNFSTIEINEGETAELVVNNYTGNITWISDNTMIATVTDGVIKAKAPGTANIYAMLSNGTNLICKVTVNEAEVTTTVTTKITTTTTTTTKATTASKTTSETTVSTSKATTTKVTTTTKISTSETIETCSVGLKFVADKTNFSLEEIRSGNAEAIVYIDSATLFSKDECICSINFKLKSSAWGKVDPINLQLCDPNALSVDKGNKPQNFENMATSAGSIWDEELPQARYGLYNYLDSNSNLVYSEEYMPKCCIMSSTSTGKLRCLEENIDNHIAQFDIKFPADLEAGTYTISFYQPTVVALADASDINSYESRNCSEAKSITFTIEDSSATTSNEPSVTTTTASKVTVSEITASSNISVAESTSKTTTSTSKMTTAKTEAVTTTSTTQQTTSISTATTQVTTTTTPEHIIGDVNNDDKVNIADVVLIQKTLVKIEVDIDFSKIDINNDGKFNVFDWIIMKRLILKN